MSSISIMIDDDLSEEMNVEDSLPVNAIFGEVLEVKSHTSLSKGINECFIICSLLVASLLALHCHEAR